MSLYPPTGFVSEMADRTEPFPGTAKLYQHNVAVECVFVWGTFDSKEAADQRDSFIDAFHNWVAANPHQAGAVTLVSPAAVADLPVFNPDWGSEAQRQTSYYASRVVLEGFATD
jgi:hypothetical protein